MGKEGKNKKGVSPVVATILLVGIVIVIALILFLWFRNFKGETCTKFGGRNIELVCSDIEFFAEYNNGELYISNTGNVPIFGMKVRLISLASYETKDITSLSGNWPPSGLNQGGTFSGSIGSLSGVDSIILIPVLMGTCGDEGEKTYMCNENQHGYEIVLS